MPDSTGRGRRRHSLYVKQNKAYQALLAVLIIAFMVVTAVVLTGSVKSSKMWKDNVLIKMIIDASGARESAQQ